MVKGRREKGQHCDDDAMCGSKRMGLVGVERRPGTVQWHHHPRFCLSRFSRRFKSCASSALCCRVAVACVACRPQGQQGARCGMACEARRAASGQKTGRLHQHASPQATRGLDERPFAAAFSALQQQPQVLGPRRRPRCSAFQAQPTNQSINQSAAHHSSRRQRLSQHHRNHLFEMPICKGPEV